MNGDPFECEKIELQSWLDKERPSNKFPFPCAITGCPMRADNSFDIVYRGETKHFCSREHMIKPWRIREEKRLPGRPKGSRNKFYKV